MITFGDCGEGCPKKPISSTGGNGTWGTDGSIAVTGDYHFHYDDILTVCLHWLLGISTIIIFVSAIFLYFGIFLKIVKRFVYNNILILTGNTISMKLKKIQDDFSLMIKQNITKAIERFK